jgi:hypothetical protein
MPMKKRLHHTLFLLLFLAGLSYACKDENLGEDDAASFDNRLESESTDDSFHVDLEVIYEGAGSRWMYTLTKNDGKDPGHFILDFGNCGGSSPTIENIVSATVNGVDWSDKISNAEGKTGCVISSDNFVKFDDLARSDEYVIEFTLDTIYSQINTTGWIKAGKSCVAHVLPGPGCRGYLLTSTMEADPSMTGKTYSEINAYMKKSGFDYSEHPNCTGGYGGHPDGVHADVVQDTDLNKSVFRFDIHIDPVIDGDRCSSGTVDRQRNEMKSITNNSTWANVQGNFDEWQILEWKFKLPQGFQPTTSFCHIHQLKAQDGPNNGAPLITITPRSNSDGSNRRIQIIHSIDGATTDKGTIVNNIPLSDFEDEWVQVREEIHYTHQGYYSCKIIRISDGKILIDFKDENIDMWPGGSSFVRSKYGIYRSLGNGRLNQTPVGQNPLLKNESILITDFRVYEKNTNLSPGIPHN